MNLLHPSSAGTAVQLWFVNDLPVRLVHADVRYRVLTAEQWMDATGWTIAARGPSAQTLTFAVRAHGDLWELSSAS